MNDAEWQKKLNALRDRYPSGRAMANVLGCTEGAVSRWLSGDRVPVYWMQDMILETLEHATRDGDNSERKERE